MDAMRGATREERAVRRNFWAKLRRLGGRIPFAEDLVAAYYCATDPATPNRVRFILMGALAYFILPTDAIADFLPLVGFADDAAVLAAALAQVAGSITPDHRAHAKATLSDEAPAAPSE
nr:YkvA family protein [Microvirga antarctica]